MVFLIRHTVFNFSSKACRRLRRVDLRRHDSFLELGVWDKNTKRENSSEAYMKTLAAARILAPILLVRRFSYKMYRITSCFGGRFPIQNVYQLPNGSHTKMYTNCQIGRLFFSRSVPRPVYSLGLDSSLYMPPLIFLLVCSAFRVGLEFAKRQQHFSLEHYT